MITTPNPTPFPNPIPTPDQVAEMIAEVDADRSGSIGLTEFCTLFAKVRGDGPG